MVKKQLAFKTPVGLGDILSKTLERFRVGGGDDQTSETVVYGESYTEEEEEEKPEKKMRAKNLIQKSHICFFCAKDSRSRSSLIRHRIVQTGERHYPCMLCGNCFTTDDNPNIHQVVCKGKALF